MHVSCDTRKSSYNSSSPNGQNSHNCQTRRDNRPSTIVQHVCHMPCTRPSVRLPALPPALPPRPPAAGRPDTPGSRCRHRRRDSCRHRSSHSRRSRWGRRSTSPTAIRRQSKCTTGRGPCNLKQVVGQPNRHCLASREQRQHTVLWLRYWQPESEWIKAERPLRLFCHQVNGLPSELALSSYRYLASTHQPYIPV